jgi:hypothetical protein
MCNQFLHVKNESERLLYSHHSNQSLYIASTRLPVTVAEKIHGHSPLDGTSSKFHSHAFQFCDTWVGDQVGQQDQHQTCW